MNTFNLTQEEMISLLNKGREEGKSPDDIIAEKEKIAEKELINNYNSIIIDKALDPTDLSEYKNYDF
jgi:hypothetical protein